MGKSLIIPGADFSAVAIPFIARVTIASNKTAYIYSGNNNVFATIEATAKEKTVDLSDILSTDNPVLFDFTFAREYDVFKKIWINVDKATTLRYAVYAGGETPILKDVLFSGNVQNISIEAVLSGQKELQSVDLSCVGGQVTMNSAFYNCSKLENINLSNIVNITAYSDAFSNCLMLQSIDFSNLETVNDETLSLGGGPFSSCPALETIIAPKLGNTNAKKFIKQLAAGSGTNRLFKYNGTNLVRVDNAEHWSYATAAPNPSTMTLWDENVWDNPVAGTTYYVDASLNRLYTYNG